MDKKKNVDRKIVVIGGGEIRKKTTKFIDQEIIKLSKKRRPKLLFIPTASSDSLSYWQSIKKYFCDLGCKTDVLFLLKECPTKIKIKKKILSSDIIYVGGGNTLMMTRIWKRLGVDQILKTAYKNGIVLCGLSAGSICWFDSGHSDSMSFYNPKKWKYINVKGLGFLKGIHCPHFDSATKGIKRRKQFQNMMKKFGGFGIAVEDNCAIKFINNSYEVISSKKNASAYKLFKKNGKLFTIKLTSNEHLPIDDLYRRI